VIKMSKKIKKEENIKDSKHLAFVTWNAMDFEKNMEIVEMAAGFLKAYLENEDNQDIGNADIFKGWLYWEESETRLEILENVIDIFRGYHVRKLKKMLGVI
jgi:hypothetical protein